MHFSLILAGFWGIVGVVLLAADPPALRLRVGPDTFSAAWPAFLLAAWNVVRWWGRRGAARRRQDLREAALRRERARRERDVPPEERNPDFVFDDPPHGGEGR